MIDVHSHILPAVDDGVKTLEESLTILHGLSALGFTHAVATPHFFPGRYTPDTDLIHKAFATVEEAIQRERIPLQIIRGRECLLDFELLDAPNRDTFSFEWNQKKFQLVELPQISVPQAISTYLDILQSEGVVPILAHAERYNRIIRDPLRAQELIDLGFRIQVDLASFARSTHRVLRATAMKLLDLDWIDLLATDIHRPSQLPTIEEAMNFVRKEYGEKRLRQYCTLD